MGVTNAETPRGNPLASLRLSDYATSLLVHPAHAATGHRGGLVLLLLLHDHALRGEEQARDGRGVLQRRPRDLGRVDDAGRNQVFERVGLGVVAEVLVLG